MGIIKGFIGILVVIMLLIGGYGFYLGHTTRVVGENDLLQIYQEDLNECLRENPNSDCMPVQVIFSVEPK